MSQHENSAQHHEGPHIVPMWLYWGVFIGLLFGTTITVLAAMVDLGPINVPLMLAIAVCKASLVALFFMHLLWDDKLNLILFISAIGFIVIFFVFTMLDPMTRGAVDPDVEREIVPEQYRLNIFDLSEEELDPLRPYMGHHGDENHHGAVGNGEQSGDGSSHVKTVQDDSGGDGHDRHDH